MAKKLSEDTENGAEENSADESRGGDNRILKPDDNNISQLIDIIAMLEKLSEQKNVIGEKIKKVMKDAKNDGWSTETIRRVLKRRRSDQKEANQKDRVFRTYWTAMSQSALGAGWVADILLL